MTVASDCAVGVAIARKPSASEEAKVFAMLVSVAWSPWAFCSSNVTSMPASAKASLKPSATASSAGCVTICAMPMVYDSAAGLDAGVVPPPELVLGLEVGSAAPEQADRVSAAIAPSAATLSFMLLLAGSEPTA